MIFADFGAGGAIICALFVVGLLVVAVASLGCLRAVRLIRSKSLERKSLGLLLLLMCVSLPFSCCVVPRYHFQATHGSPPLGKYPSGVVKEGMTADEVRAALGNPHEVHDYPEGGGHWYYWLDWFSIDWFGVLFGPDGRVTASGGS